MSVIHSASVSVWN